MANYFDVEFNVVELTITLYFLGFATGNFFGGPLSDSFGRKTIALIGISLYAISAFAIPFCPKIEYILILRVIQAFGGGFATVTANIFVRDWYSGKRVARFLTIISMIMMLAPLVAPVLGTGLLHWKGWQSIFFFLFGFALLLFITFLILIPESRDKALITRKFTREQLLSKYKIFFSDKQSVLMLFAISFPMAGLYIFISSASFMYLEYFKIDQLHFPLVFSANVVLNILLSLLNTFLLKKYDPSQILKTGLLIQLLSGVTLFISILFPVPSFWIVFSSIVLFVGSLGLVFGNGTAVILNFNPEVSGSANATIGITRFVLGFLIGSLIALFHTGNLKPIGAFMFLCTLFGNILYFKVMNKLETT
jgi:DHA1 family bicyclomycin/chloramphenicol resistance-like MFS transporter